MSHQHNLISIAAIALCIGYATAKAQTPLPDTGPALASGPLAEVIITAQKREESIQRTPLSVTAISEDLIERRQIDDVGDLEALSPGLNFGKHDGNARLFIRGIGFTGISPGQDPSVALQVDGVVIARPFAQLASLFDIERIEVLRGPQGTLYGRNATGGTVNLITREPTSTPSGYLNVDIGNYDLIEANGALSGPLAAAGDLRGRIAFQRVKRGGYGYNVTLHEEVNDQDTWATRGTIQFEPADGVDVTLTGDYSREDDADNTFAAFGPYRNDVPLMGVVLGGIVIPYSRNVTTDIQTVNDRTIWGTSATIGVDLGERWQLKSISAYRDSERQQIFDPDTTSGVAFTATHRDEHSKQFSEELQFLYTSSRLEGVAGLFYYDEWVKAQLDLGLRGIGTIRFGFPDARTWENGEIDIKAYAVFTQWTYKVTADLRLTAGLRYSDEERNSSGVFTIFNGLLGAAPPDFANIQIPIDVKRSWSAYTPKFGIDYSLNEDVMLYASATKGFKSGVLSIGNPNPPINPEYVWSYEAGVKSMLFENRLQLNGAVFYTDLSDMQVSRVVNNRSTTVNAASATIRGVEVELLARPVSSITLNANVSYLDTEFEEFTTQHPGRPELGMLDLSGNRLPNSPEWTINAGVQIDIPARLAGSLSLRGDVSWTSKLYFTEFNDNNLSADDVALVDASLQYESANGRWRTSLWGKNLTDKDIPANIYIGSAATGYVLNGAWKPPRTYGLTVGYSFD